MDGTTVEELTPDCNEDYTGAVCLLHKLTKKYPAYREILIDAEDLDAVAPFTWLLNAVGKMRTVRPVRKGGVYLHTVLMNPLPGMTVDHLFHRALDNRKSKLRICTVRENNLNTRGSGRGTSRFKGVSWAGQVGKWYAQAGIRGSKTSLGHFSDEVEAARAYNEYAKKHYGPAAYLNPV